MLQRVYISFFIVHVNETFGNEKKISPSWNNSYSREKYPTLLTLLSTFDESTGSTITLFTTLSTNSLGPSCFSISTPLPSEIILLHYTLVYSLKRLFLRVTYLLRSRLWRTYGQKKSFNWVRTRVYVFGNMCAICSNKKIEFSVNVKKRKKLRKKRNEKSKENCIKIQVSKKFEWLRKVTTRVSSVGSKDNFTETTDHKGKVKVLKVDHRNKSGGDQQKSKWVFKWIFIPDSDRQESWH